MSAQLHNWTEEEYFSDPCEAPSLSQSIATTLVKRSPLHAWTEHPRLGGIPRPPTRSLDDGTAVHELLLGGDRIVEVQHDDFRTKEARGLRDDAIEAGKVPIVAPKLAELRDVAESLRVRIEALGFDLDGESEQSMTWREQTPHGPVLCRGRMDHLHRDRGLIVDLKTTKNASPDVLPKHFIDYGYDVQWAAYTSGLAKVEPKLAGRIDMVFLFCELLPPYAVTPVRCAGTMREMGNARWARALEMWAWCTKHDTWPGYSDEAVAIEAPIWALTKEEEEAA